MDTQGNPWCATEVDEAVGEMIPGKWGKCVDERTIAYASAAGHYCSVPFLMNDRYYDTCTRHTPDRNALNPYYWCPKPQEVSLSLPFDGSKHSKGKCSDFLIPEPTGCMDHYTLIDGHCLRVSTKPVMFQAALDACALDGADLLSVINEELQNAAAQLIERKRLEFEHYSKTENFWIAATSNNNSEWSWRTHFQAFDKYTNWQASTPNLGCPPTGCSTLNAMVMQREDDFSWRASDFEESFGYVCMSKCSQGYSWYPRVGQCLRVVPEQVKDEGVRNLPQAMVQCGIDGGTLIPVRSCSELIHLRHDLLKFLHPEHQIFQIGTFAFAKDPMATRHAPEDVLTDGLDYAIRVDDFSQDSGWCSKTHLTQPPLNDTKPYGFGLNLQTSEAIIVRQELVENASTLGSYGYICQQERSFGCPEGYAMFQSKCLKVFQEKVAKMDAEMTCRLDGANLVRPTTHLEAQFIHELIREMEQSFSVTETMRYWLGFHALSDETQDPLGMSTNPTHNISITTADCVTLEKSGPTHIFVSTNCVEQAGFVCATEQRLKAHFVEDVPKPVLLAPLNKALGPRDISSNALVIVDHNVGYASMWAPSQMIGYPLLAGAVMQGRSYIEVKSGPRQPDQGSGLTVLFWLKIDQDPDGAYTILDFRNSLNRSEGLFLGWEQGNLKLDLGDGTTILRGLDSYHVKSHDTWTFLALTYDGNSNRGTFFIGDTFGYRQDEEDFLLGYFRVNSSRILDQAMAHPGLIGSDKFDPDQALSGSLSCLQIFDRGLPPAYISYLKDCESAPNQVSDPCPKDFEFFDDMCYRIALDLLTFVQAEIACASNAGPTGNYRSQLMWTRKREHYEFIGRVMKEKVDESEFWIGLDGRSGSGSFESSTGGEVINRTDPIWNPASSGSGVCAMIPGPNGGFPTTGDCSASKAYVCQQVPLYKTPDNDCPRGFFSIKEACLMPVREEMTYDKAREHCGMYGSSLYASRSVAQFQFIQQYARNEIPIDFWMGVSSTAKAHVVDASVLDFGNPLQLLDSNEKTYADGTDFEEQSSFGFDFSSNKGIWSGPCLYLKASVGYAARNARCSQEFAFFCDWKIAEEGEFLAAFRISGSVAHGGL
eukprot:maker-scaffold1272_size51402-snap-gene-0.12 protein:Tk07865 transcript:maker-scaffold1272_size51402-snap-gene-0.12-mRNA-1 annotation:"macrophage mannose receptor 1-like isoform x1"